MMPTQERCLRCSFRLALILFAVSQVLSAAVDCRNPKNRQERVVCANPELMDLDRQLSSVYEKAMAEKSGAERQQFAYDQSSWEDSSGGCWDRADCIKKRYTDRIAALEAMIAKASAPKPVQPSTPGQIPDQPSPMTYQDALKGIEARNQVRDEQRSRAQEAQKAAGDSAKEVLRLEEEQRKLIDKLNALRESGEPWLMPERHQEARQRMAGGRGPGHRGGGVIVGGNGAQERAEAESNKARIEELQSQIAAMTPQLESRQKRFETRTFEQGRQVLDAMRKRAASTEFKSMKGTMANSSNQLNKQCDQLAAALDKGNLQEIVSLTNGVRNLGDTLEKTRVDSLRAEADRANELARQKAVMGTATGRRVYDGCYAWAKRQGLIAGTQVRVFKDEETNKAAEMATNPGEPLCRCITVQVAGNNEITDAAKLEIGHIMETQNKAGPGPLGVVVSAAMGQCYNQSFKNMIGR
jgi:hypothetical protein